MTHEQLLKKAEAIEQSRQELIKQVYQVIAESGLTVDKALDVLDEVKRAVQFYSYVSSSNKIEFNSLGFFRSPRHKQP